MIAEHLLFQSDGGFIRIPIWGHIPLSGPPDFIHELRE